MASRLRLHRIGRPLQLGLTGLRGGPPVRNDGTTNAQPEDTWYDSYNPRDPLTCRGFDAQAVPGLFPVSGQDTAHRHRRAGRPPLLSRNAMLVAAGCFRHKNRAAQTISRQAIHFRLTSKSSFQGCVSDSCGVSRTVPAVEQAAINAMMVSTSPVLLRQRKFLSDSGTFSIQSTPERAKVKGDCPGVKAWRTRASTVSAFYRLSPAAPKRSRSSSALTAASPLSCPPCARPSLNPTRPPLTLQPS